MADGEENGFVKIITKKGSGTILGATVVARHAGEMIKDTAVGMIIHATTVPFLPEAKELAKMGMLPGGLHRNREFHANMVEIERGVPGYLADILYDPQTSGGLLIAVPDAEASPLLKKMRDSGIQQAAIIGEIITEPKGKIIVK